MLAWGKCYETGAYGYVRVFPPANLPTCSLAHSNRSDKTLPLSRLPLLAAVGGSMVTRTASRRAFSKQGRGVVTQDMLGEIGGAFAETFGEDEKGWGVQGAGKL